MAFPGPRQVPRRCSRSRDAVGNRLQVNELVPNALGTPGQTTSVQNTYGYDRLYRLTNVNSPSTPTYTYDPIGNRLTNPTTSYSYDRADRITAAGSTPYTVDAAGNLTARGSDSFSYDQANRLTSATVGGTMSTYVYDGDGKRASKTVGSTTTSYVYDPSKALPDVLTDGTLKYVYGLSLAYAVDSAGNVQVYHADGLGSVRAITDGTGTLTQTYQTDPFGVPTQVQGTSTQPFQFAGQQQDAESSFYYLRARYYDPTTGRFVERDPSPCQRTSANNLYVYSRDNPTNLTDPSGLTPGLDSSGFGPKACTYYDNVSREDPSDTYAARAGQCCRDFGDSQGARCARKCLITYDATICRDPGTRNRPTIQYACRVLEHLTCFRQCNFFPLNVPWSCLNAAVPEQPAPPIQA